MTVKVIYNGYDKPLNFNGSEEEAYLLDYLRSNEIDPGDVPVESVISILDGSRIELEEFVRTNDGRRELNTNGAEFQRYTAHYPVLVEWKN